MKNVQTLILDWKEFSDEAYEQLEKAIKAIGFHLGHGEIECYGQIMSDTYYLYIAKKKLTKKQVEKLFDFYE